jgi:hypothetical protein
MTQPAAELVPLLAEKRREGAPFPVAWQDALRTALQAAHSDDDRARWRAALVATTPAWESAYERHPATRPERAAAAVLDDEREVLAPGDPVDFGGPGCAYCGQPLGADAHHCRQYCDDVCKRQAEGTPTAARPPAPEADKGSAFSAYPYQPETPEPDKHARVLFAACCTAVCGLVALGYRPSPVSVCHCVRSSCAMCAARARCSAVSGAWSRLMAVCGEAAGDLEFFSERS